MGRMDIQQDYNEQCLQRLIWAMNQLGIDLDAKKLVNISELIVQTMTGPWRYFHTPDHIFEVGGSEDAIEVLAALFHDVVYVQVDQSVNFNLTYYLVPFIRQVGEHLWIREAVDIPEDPTFEMVRIVFDMSPGKMLLPLEGQNEFLSALVAAKVLQPFLSQELLVQIVACIEATIPFRTPTPTGLNNSDVLYQRLQAIVDKFNLKLTDADLIETVKRSIRMANRDVRSFADPSSARFLDNTWNLIPETNHHLNNPSAYTIGQYRTALQKMEGFMNFLKPEVVFHQFRGYPEDSIYEQLVSRARRNIAVGRLYLGSKLFTIAFLEALSLRFGRVIPVSTLMGEMPSENFVTVSLVNFLPDLENNYQPQDELESTVLVILEKGRTQHSYYDIKNSPLTTYMVKQMGFAEIQNQRNRAQKFFQNEISSEEFLAGCDPQIKKTVTEGIVKLFDTRKAAFLGG